MAIRTAFTELFHVDHPLVLAPMGGVSGGVLAAAVSEAGGFGLVGGGYADLGWLERELRTVAGATDKPWGVGVITWAAEVSPGAPSVLAAYAKTLDLDCSDRSATCAAVSRPEETTRLIAPRSGSRPASAAISAGDR